MKYGYARVSSLGQEKHGNSLDYQEALLKKSGAEIIYKETFTGTKLDRPILKELLSKLERGDELIVSKLDRMARSAAGGIKLIDELTEKGITINILNMGRFDRTPIGKLLRTVMLAISEFERDTIMERMNEGKAAAKIRKGGRYREGRKPFSHPELRSYQEKVKNGEMSASHAYKALGIAKSTWYKKYNEYIA